MTSRDACPIMQVNKLKPFEDCEPLEWLCASLYDKLLVPLQSFYHYITHHKIPVMGVPFITGFITDVKKLWYHSHIPMRESLMSHSNYLRVHS